MRTPAGKECLYFYGDYHRGRNIEQCRLLTRSQDKMLWESSMCSSCDVPNIQAANSCKDMKLSLTIKKKWLIGKNQPNVLAYCTKSNLPVSNPYVGCGECRPGTSMIEELFNKSE